MGNEKLAVLTIPNGGTESDALSDHLSKGQMNVLGALEQLSVAAPATLTGIVTVEVAQEYPGTTWRELQDYLNNPMTVEAGADVGIPYVTWRDLRLVSGGAEAAAREFTVRGKLAYPGS